LYTVKPQSTDDPLQVLPDHSVKETGSLAPAVPVFTEVCSVRDLNCHNGKINAGQKPGFCTAEDIPPGSLFSNFPTRGKENLSWH
jgi:hypothetical protein